MPFGSRAAALVIAAGCLLPGGSAGAAAPSPSPAPPAPPRAELSDPLCVRALDPANREVSITAVMRPVRGTERMALKTELQRRLRPGGRFRIVPGRGFGRWRFPGNPTLGQVATDVWAFTYRVENLSGPAYYRFRVWFRWMGAGGRVLSEAQRLSPVCYQPEPRADLVVRGITILTLTGGRDRYLAAIHNGGATAAGRFAVELLAGGVPAQSLSIAALAPGETVREAFVGPACAPGSPVTVVADPTRQVDDARRANNTLSVRCPVSSGTRAPLHLVKR
jgi:hypothetical protein